MKKKRKGHNKEFNQEKLKKMKRMKRIMRN